MTAATTFAADAVTIRPFTPDDYEGVAAVDATLYTDYATTADELRHQDATRAPNLFSGQVVAEEDGRVAGYAQFQHLAQAYHPQKFWVDLLVRPEAQGRGVGRALYARMWDELAPHDPAELRTRAREDHERALRFLADRGWREDQRDQESRLDLSAFDPAAYTADVERATAQGIRLCSFAELKAAETPGLFEKLEEIHWTLNQDVPHTAELTRPPLSEFLKRFENPGFLPDGNFYALDGDRIVGASILWKNGGNDSLRTGLTGVRAEYRKRGIATALKVKALNYAKASGATAVYTWNEVNNNGMLGINFRLGFVRRPAWIEFVREIKEVE